MRSLYDVVAFFFFNDTATTEIYTLSLHDALPIFAFSFAASSIYCFNDIYDVEADRRHPVKCRRPIASGAVSIRSAYLLMGLDRKSTRLNSSHANISYAVFCLKKKTTGLISSFLIL